MERLEFHKRILITAGAVYGRLDDNKIVSNRSRGIWAAHLARVLADRGHQVVFLMPKVGMELPSEFKDILNSNLMTVWRHDGFDEYQDICIKLASQVDVAVMAAAVVNWIPKEPFKGKMPTKGVGEEMSITFRLAPRVLDKMKYENKKLMLIGCKMVVDEPHESMIKLAYSTLHSAKCSVVVANDLKNLKRKYLVYPDATEHEYTLVAEDTCGGDRDEFTTELVRTIEDRYYKTEIARFHNPGVDKDYCAFFDPDSFVDDADTIKDFSELERAEIVFNTIVEKYRSKFTSRLDDPDKVFGSLAVRVGKTKTFLVSPRAKYRNFRANDAVQVHKVDTTKLRVYTDNGRKATLNAPLLIRMLDMNPDAVAVLHLHTYLNQGTVVSYAPPGTERDNNRDLVRCDLFNIEDHGFVSILDKNLELPVSIRSSHV
jgi:hypothetical protein